MSEHNHNDDITRTFVQIGAGTKVAHYVILERIGAGGMGEVYLAEDTKLNRRVALKFMPTSMAKDPDLRQRFTREAQAAAKLDHPNIVTIYEVSEFNDRPFFAMQFIEGKTLRHYCRDEKLSYEQVISVGIQVAEGLARAHGSGVIHRDIKSANIILDTELHPKILDFGLATVRGTESLTKAGSTMGTFAYMSPEQVQGKEVDHRSDQFSLGVVLYELIAGVTPHRADNEVAMAHKIISEAPNLLSVHRQDVPEEFQRVIMRALSKNQNDRFATTGDLVTALKEAGRAIASDFSGVIGRQSESKPSIAVLPFANMSADPENEFFADGLTEELLNVMAKNPELKVTGRTSSFAFKGKHEDLRSIGNKLGVGTILEGSVRKAGNRVRITAQLVKTIDGFHLWSETYDRVIEDVFAVQDEIAGSVSKALHVTLLGSNQTRAAMNPENLIMLQQARDLRRQWTKESVEKAVTLLTGLIETEPNNAHAWSALATSYFMQAAFGFDDNQVAYRQAKKAAMRALELDDTLSDSYVALGNILGAFELLFEESEKAYRRAYELSPNNSHAVTCLSLVEALNGNWEKAIRLARHSVEIDPLSTMGWNQLGRSYYWCGENFQAREAFFKVQDLSSNVVSLQISIAMTFLQEGDLATALSYVERETGPGYKYCGLAIVYHALGEKTKSEESLQYLLDFADRTSWSFQIALVYAFRGEKDEAFSWLETARKSRDAGVPTTKVHPLLENIRGDARYKPLLKRIGFKDA